MAYELKTPTLIEAADMARAAYRGIMTKTLDAREAGAVNGSSGRLISAVSTDVRARLAAPRIAELEGEIEQAEQSEKPRKKK